MARPFTEMLRLRLPSTEARNRLSTIADHVARVLLAAAFIWFWWHWRGDQVRMDADLARLGTLSSVQINDYLAVSLLRHSWMLIPLLYVGTRFSWKQILVIAVWMAVGSVFLFDQYAASARYNQAMQQQIVVSPDNASKQKL